MEKVVKVSIAGVSFTLESGAHLLLEQYLLELKECYGAEENVQEIMEDIEERIAELIVEKDVKERVVSSAEVEDIINVLGHPSDIAGEQQDGPLRKKVAGCRRQLFRDSENRVIGGVCSGLGAYFRTDPVLVRILFVVLFLLSSAFREGAFGFMVLLYILLWIIVPAAKTVEQRCAMKGESTGIDQIKKKADVGVRNMGKEMSEIGKSGAGLFFMRILGFVGFCLGVLFLIIGFAGVITGSLLCIGVEVFEGLSAIELLDYVELGISETIWIKVFALLSYFLPFVGILYVGLCICFKFKAPAWNPGLVIFLLWIMSLLAFGIVLVKAMNPYYDHSSGSTDIELVENYGTIYVKMEEFPDKMQSKQHIDKGKNHYNAKYIKRESSTGGLEFIDYPYFKIVRCAPERDGKPFRSYVECCYSRYHRLSPFDVSTVFNAGNVVEVKDSLICVKYRSYTREKRYSGEHYRLYLHVPDGTEVKIIE